VNSQHRIEQMRQANPLRFRDQPEQRAIAVETPGTAKLDDLQRRLAVAVQELVGNPTVGGFVGQFQGFRTEPLNTDNRNKRVGHDAAHDGIGLEFFEFHRGISSGNIRFG
jgi:hypothetical protein